MRLKGQKPHLGWGKLIGAMAVTVFMLMIGAYFSILMYEQGWASALHEVSRVCEVKGYFHVDQMFYQCEVKR